jgi:hypothetical protein
MRHYAGEVPADIDLARMALDGSHLSVGPPQVAIEALGEDGTRREHDTGGAQDSHRDRDQAHQRELE